MDNRIKETINTIEIPAELSKRSHQGIQEASQVNENSNRKNWKIVGSLLLSAAIILVILTQLDLFSRDQAANEVIIPPIELPEGTDLESAAMPGLIVYQGSIYTNQSWVRANPEQVDDLIGEQLGTTHYSIDEWKETEDNEMEFASNLEEPTPVYSVNGYDESFRIMTYDPDRHPTSARLFEKTNDLTLRSGRDFFEQLNLSGNIVHVTSQTWEQYFQETGQFSQVDDMSLIDSLVENLNHTLPEPFPNSYDTRFDKDIVDEKVLFLFLEDGLRVQLQLLEGGYITYPTLQVFFKMQDDDFERIWNSLE